MFSKFIALIVGFFPAFFIVFNSIFSDVGPNQVTERLFTFLLVFSTYILLGFVFGYFKPQSSWRWGIWLSIPAIIIVALYSFLETQYLLLHLFYLALTLGSSCLGGYTGAKVKQRYS